MGAMIKEIGAEVDLTIAGAAFINPDKGFFRLLFRADSGAED